MSKRTKIVATIGPSTHDIEMLRKIIRAGVNVARLNFSHGTHAMHAQFISNIRQIAMEENTVVAIIQDLQGPKIRVGDLPEDGVTLNIGEQIIFSTSNATQLPKIFVCYENLHKDVKSGDRLLFDDGLLETEVVEVSGQDIITKVIIGGILKAHKGLNVPTASLSASPLTDKDKEDLLFGLAQNVDFIALSFVRNAQDVLDLRKLIETSIPPLVNIIRGAVSETSRGDGGIHQPQIIVKIERHEAVANFPAILAATDCVMVARGDLGIEIPAEEVPIVQKRLIEMCLLAAKPVIVATQMLDSMIRNPRPTRAEVSDVANAVIDHTDAVMLSGETASGKYPMEAVEVMSRVIIETESSIYDDVTMPVVREHLNTSSAIVESAKLLSEELNVTAVLVASETGTSGRLLSSLRPKVPLFVITKDDHIARQLNLSWGVNPIVLPAFVSFDEYAVYGVRELLRAGYIKLGDKVLVVGSNPMNQPGHVNVIEVRDV